MTDPRSEHTGPTRRPWRRRAAGAAALGLTVALVASACGGSGSDGNGGDANGPTTTAAPQMNKVGGTKKGPADGKPTAGGKLAYGIDAEPEGMDPTRYAFSQAGHAVASAVFEPLATLDENGQVVPYLATSFEHSDDNKTWTVKLPSGVTFHDGTPLNADAVVKDFTAYKESLIVGTALVAVDSITAKDDTTVVFALNRPLASLPALFATQAGYIFAPSMIGNPEAGANPVGTGPFVFDSHTPGQNWQFKKNPNYRRQGLPYLDNIDFVAIPDPATRTDKLRSNELDVIQTQDGKQILDLRASDLKQAENVYGDKAFLIVNTSKPPFDNLTARRAVAFATNAPAFKEARAGVVGNANSPYGPGQPGYTETNDYPQFDLDKAKELVAQYKTETGKDLAFTVLGVDDPTNMTMTQVFADSFTKAGMQVTIESKPQINLLAAVAAGGYELSQFRIFASPNPDADVHFYRSSSIGAVSLNFPRYANPEVDKAIDEATATLDEGKRNEAYLKVNKIFSEQVPMMWLGQEVWMVAANPKVNGIYEAANGSIAIVGPKTWIATLSVTR